MFLLLIFFMLASRFAIETRLEVAAAGQGAGYKGPPRLVSVEKESVLLNGAPIDVQALPAALDKLVTSRAQIIVLQAKSGADVQNVVVVLDALKAAGFERVALTE